MLIGNGLERASNQLSWNQLVDNLTAANCISFSEEEKESIPFPLLYEAIILNVPIPQMLDSAEIKREEDQLKTEMGYPLEDSLCLFIPSVGTFHSQRGNISFPVWEYSSPCEQSSELQVARYQMQASKHEWHQARASLLPTLSLSAGLNTTYYKTLHSKTAASFGSQFKNNMGEYVGVSVSIPLFNRLQTITSIRRAKNNYRIAQEAYDQKQLELEKLSREAWQDWQGYLKQTTQMEKKVEADSIAYQLTRRQFEEGLSTAIDLHTTSLQLLNSKATLLQCRLMAMVKEQFVRYYRGETIWTE